ncbi:hypothetical protein AOLI_G00202120 [Acnodon oligacanthus]
MPMLVAFMFGIYLLKQEFWCDLEHQSLAPGNKGCSFKKCKIWFFKVMCFLTPPIVWATLFFGDGRYVACLSTEIDGKSADTAPKPPWEWCSKDRNLTNSQWHARESFYKSKVAGFGSLLLIFILLFIVLLCKCGDQQLSSLSPASPASLCTAAPGSASQVLTSGPAEVFAPLCKNEASAVGSTPTSDPALPGGPVPVRSYAPEVQNDVPKTNQPLVLHQHHCWSSGPSC